MASEITFDEACTILESTLRGETRAAIVSELARSKNLNEALTRLRAGMRSHIFKTGSGQLNLENLVRRMDTLTKQDGFNVLIDWDGKAAKWLTDSIPVDVVTYFIGAAQAKPIGPRQRKPLEILLDYYFLYLVALMSMRVNDEGNPDDNLDRLTRMIADLQGPAGSGQKHADNPEMLILVATSHFEPDEKAYDRLGARMKCWNSTHQVNVARAHAAVLGSHLRHGFKDLYKRDVGLMRDDNEADYPGLCFSLLTLMREYERLHVGNVRGSERDRVVEALINGLTADPRAFVASLPRGLKDYAAEQAEFCETFHRYKADLFEEFELSRPVREYYSAIALCFNFPHNIMKGMVIDAVLRGEPGHVTLNDLLSGLPKTTWSGKPAEGREGLARALSTYAEQDPDDHIDGRPVPVIHYDPQLGTKNFIKTIATLKEHTLDKKCPSAPAN